MSKWDASQKTLSLKLVFYGPALSGKTTNLIALHDLLQPNIKGDMQILETKNDRTLFFDLLPLGIRTNDGTLIKLKLYTVPGQVIHNSTRKAVLSRSDGVIFVADSQTNQSQNNAQSFNNLLHNVRLVGLDIDTLPLVVQFNKRDLSNVLSVDELQNRWSKSTWKLFFASALNKQGVLETFTELLKLVYRLLEQDHLLHSRHGLSQQVFIQQIIDGQDS